MRTYQRVCPSITRLAAWMSLSMPVLVIAQSEPAIAPSFPTPSEIIKERLHEGFDQQEIYKQSCNSVVRVEMSDTLGSTLITGFFIDENGLIATVISTNRVLTGSQSPGRNALTRQSCWQSMNAPAWHC
ncbi:MAG: hypothetical protein R3F19_15675 [Verrucomicrobiales bacterium]